MRKRKSIIYTITHNRQEEFSTFRTLMFVVAVLISCNLLSFAIEKSTVTIGKGEVGEVIRNGRIVRILGQGTYFRYPIIDRIIIKQEGE